MKRVSRFWDRVPAVAAVDKFNLILDLGSAQTKLSINGQVAWHQPSLALIHPISKTIVSIGQGREDIQVDDNQVMMTTPVSWGAVNDLDLAVAYLEWILNKVWSTQPRRHWWRSVTGKWVVPSDATATEKKICRRVLDKSSEGRWQIITKADRWTELFSQALAFQGWGASLDIGWQTTELVLAPLAGRPALAKTWYQGLAQVNGLIEQVIRTQWQCLVGAATIEQVRRQLQLTEENTGATTRLAIRGQKITSQQPATMVIELAPIAVACLNWFDQLVTRITDWLEQIEITQTHPILDRGLILSGGGASIIGLATRLQDQLKTEVKVSPTAETDLTYVA